MRKWTPSIGVLTDEVLFTAPARADLEQIFSYIAQDNPSAAGRQLIDRAKALAQTPYAGREVDEPNARVIVVSGLRYFIFYEVADNEINITYPAYIA